jgi:hypothetical protein
MRKHIFLPAILAGSAVFASAAITPHIVLNRSSGVAPCAIFVDATATGGLANGDYINASFAWNFDQGGVDPNGKHTRTRGFVAAHVYEKPGTYTLSLDVVDRSGAAASTSVSVEIAPFTGTTYYVAAGGSDSAAGTSMAQPPASADYALGKKAKPNTRILFRKGDLFVTPAFSVAGTGGPVIVGAYTDPNKVSDQAPLLCNRQDGWGFISLGEKTSDWRLMDLHVRGCGVSTSVSPAQRGFSLFGSDILFLRVEVDSMARDAFAGGGVNNFIFDCPLHDFGGYGYWCDPIDRGAFVGTISLRQSGGEHLFRTQSGSKEFIADNELREAIDVMSGIQIRGNSSQAYLIGNRVEKDCAFHPQNSTSEEHESYCVADGNTFIGAGFGIAAKHIAIRNNRFYNGIIALDVHPLVGMSDSVTIIGNSCYGRRVNELVLGSAANTMIKNNVLYTATTDDWASGLSLGNALANYQIDYNIYYAPNKSNHGNLWFVVDGVELGRSGFAAWQASGSDAHGRYADPVFLSIDSSSIDFLKPGPGSPAIGAGAIIGETAPVFCDFFGNPRKAGQATDAGACLYGTPAAAMHDWTFNPIEAPRLHPGKRGPAGRPYDPLGRVLNGHAAKGKSRAAVPTLRKNRRATATVP